MKSGVQYWLDAAGRYPLLTAEQELMLGARVQRGMAEGATEREKRSGKRAADRMMLCNLRLVVDVVKRFSNRVKTSGASFEDLLQEGALGLVRGIELYDPKRGYRFSTYAYWWIRQAVVKALDRSPLITMPASLEALRVKAAYAPASVQTRKELQEWLGVSEQRMLKVEHAHLAKNLLSIDAGAMDGEEHSFHDVLATPEGADCFEVELYADAMNKVEELAAIDEPLRYLIRFSGEEKLKDLASEAGVCRLSLRRQMTAARERLHEVLPDVSMLLSA